MSRPSQLIANTGAKRLRAIALPIAIVAIAGALRLWQIGEGAQNPFYDAAVHSMGLSWHNFFFGALDPSGRLAIDKPPLDLWLQVAGTKLIGFNRTALALPEALGGIVAVALLYAAVTRAYGPVAGGLSALALAVLPVAVLTSRSDTMDSVMSALLIASLWCSVIAIEQRRARYVAASAALLGLAFNVKLAQALVPLPALALMWWAALQARRRIGHWAMVVAVLLSVAMSWALVASLTPLKARPFPMGSRTGSIYRAMFVFDGIGRLTGGGDELASRGFSSGPGIGRLMGVGRPYYGMLVGLELVAVCVLLIAGCISWTLSRKPRERPRTADRLAGALVVWMGVAYALFSAIGRLQPRYLEAMSPAIAGIFGIAMVYLMGRVHTRSAAWLCATGLAINAAFAIQICGVGDIGVQICLLASAVAFLGLCMAPLRRLLAMSDRAIVPRLRMALLTLMSLALLAAPAEASIDLVEERTSDANPTGSGSQYGNYLKAHRNGARYEVAAANPLAVVGLIARDAQPVLILRTIDGIQLSVAQLKRLVNERAVRYAILPEPCVGGPHCTPTTAWSIRHATMVLPGLYRYRASPQWRR